MGLIVPLSLTWFQKRVKATSTGAAQDFAVRVVDGVGVKLGADGGDQGVDSFDSSPTRSVRKPNRLIDRVMSAYVFAEHDHIAIKIKDRCGMNAARSGKITLGMTEPFR